MVTYYEVNERIGWDTENLKNKNVFDFLIYFHYHSVFD